MGILRSEDFLITTWVGEASRKVIWNGHKAHDLDMPLGWVIERSGEKNFRIRNSSIKPWTDQVAQAVEFEVPEPGYRQMIELPIPRARGPARPLDVEIVHMKPIEPVYILRHQMAPQYPSKVPKQLMMFYGERYYLVRYRPVPASKTVSAEGRDVFQYTRTPTGYAVIALSHGVKLKTATERYNIPIGARAELSEQAFFSATVIFGVHWWRFRMVPTPDSMPPVETEETEDDIREDTRFKVSALVFLIVFSIMLSMMYSKSLHEKPAPKVIAAVEIKAPKIIPPTKEELKPPPPPPPPPPEPPPKKEVVELKPEKKPEPKPKPKKEIVKKEKPKRAPKIAKMQPPKAPPPKSPEPPPPPVKSAEQVAAEHAAQAAAQKAKEAEAMKQQMMKSLGFLSTSSKRAAADPKKYEQKEGRYTDTPTVGGDVSKTTALGKIVKDAPGDGSIHTNSSRTVSSSVDFGPRKGKGLNDVQGKVSLGELYSGGGKLGDSIGGSGLAISGLGSVSEGEIEKALSKYLQRFQFCYEKALLTDNSLGGKIVVQWTISSAGVGQSPKVLSSQMNNNDLHGCISKVLKEIPFPKPKGGTVQVKKTFAFSSSTL